MTFKNINIFGILGADNPFVNFFELRAPSSPIVQW
jgi:hypothetical protein